MVILHLYKYTVKIGPRKKIKMLVHPNINICMYECVLYFQVEFNPPTAILYTVDFFLLILNVSITRAHRMHIIF